MSPARATASRRRITVRSLVLAGVLVALVAGCGTAGSASSNSAAEPVNGNMITHSDAAVRSSDASDARAASDVQQRAVISTGAVDLLARDVATVHDEAVDLAIRYGGQTGDDHVTTDRHGRAEHADLVLRVPSGRFTTAMARLARLARLRSSTSTSKDVTTQVIDIGERVRAQRIGLHRLDTLLGKSADLGNLLKVEEQVTERQGDLDSLLAQQKYLTDQTSLATITVHIDRLTHPAAKKAPSHTTGFVSGVDRGWDALVAVVVGLLTALGLALPFAVPIAVLAAIAWLLYRRYRPGRRPQPAG